MEKSRYRAASHSQCKGYRKAEPWVHAVYDKHRRDYRAHGHSAVHGQVGEVQYAVGYVNTYCKQGVHKSLFKCYA